MQISCELVHGKRKEWLGEEKGKCRRRGKRRDKERFVGKEGVVGYGGGEVKEE